MGAVAVLACLSLAITLGWTLDLHNADSLIPVFVSLDLWMPFFWGQDRFGMLLALLAVPIKDSFWNLVAQNAAGTFLLALGAFAGARKCGARNPLLVASALLAGLLFWPSESLALHTLTTNQSYSPALGLYGLAFATYRERASMPVKILTGVLAMAAAWTNAGTAVLCAVVLTVALASPVLRRQALPMLGVTVASLAFHRCLQAVTPGTILDHSHLTFVTPREFGRVGGGFWVDAYGRLLGPAAWVALGGALIACYSSRRNRQLRDGVGAVIAGFFLYGVVLVVFFDGVGRQLTPAIPLLLAATFIAAEKCGMRTSVSASVTVALAGAVVLGSGLDSPQGARRRLLNNLGEGNAIELYQDAVTVVTGDYWVAWPYAFALNMLYERAEGTRPVLAVALRSDDVYTRRAGQIRTGTRVAVVPTSDYRYWTFKGPVVALSVLRAETAYEVAVVQSYVEGLAGKVGIADQGSRADRQQPPVRNAADKLAVD